MGYINFFSGDKEGRRVHGVTKMNKWCCWHSWGQICTSLIWQCYQIELLTSLVFRLFCYSALFFQSEKLSVFYEKIKKTMHNLIIVIKGLFCSFQCVLLSFIPGCCVFRESVLQWQPFALTLCWYKHTHIVHDNGISGTGNVEYYVVWRSGVCSMSWAIRNKCP